MTKLGSYEAYSIETGRIGLDGGAMFGVVPKSLWSRKIEPDSANRINMAMRCLLLVEGNNVILIDNGLGDKYTEKFAGNYAVDHEHSELNRSLSALGLNREDVTHMILTHLHFDHCGGSTLRNGDDFDLAFPNAKHIMQKSHWEWALKSNAREKASFLNENIEPIKSKADISLLEDDGEILPGINSLTVNGHTVGQQVIEVSNGDSPLYFCADLFPTQNHISPVWGMSYDLDPLKAIDEKRVFLEKIISEGGTLFLEHDAFTEVVDVELIEGRFSATNHRTLSQL